VSTPGEVTGPERAGVVADVPAVVRSKALAVGAARWIDELPGLVEVASGLGQAGHVLAGG